MNPIGPRACYDEGKRVAETMCYAYMKQVLNLYQIWWTFYNNEDQMYGKTPVYVFRCRSAKENVLSRNVHRVATKSVFSLTQKLYCFHILLFQMSSVLQEKVL